MGAITVNVKQQSLTTSVGTARHHTVLIDRPVAKEGTDLGAMGGELLLVALGGCFSSNLLELVRNRQVPISDIDIQIVGTLSDTPPSRYTKIVMEIRATYKPEERETLEKFVIMAERACIVANTLRDATPLTFTVI